ncbi:lectin family integral membrane [Niveomyces insectorum RCEF 264]|uniref:Lectin family integral membrane n=1 Tax=Niveomyces insectorum RCEF 264 TaxID=1081102 RepID=A0A168A1F0_9HYPO|nr:lectin family integral membrane [Niveomyces insectorum RCEF 264]
MRFSWSLLAGAAHAQYIINELSFGYGGRIAPEHSRNIPHFHLLGSPYQPEILSNKLVLTPAAPAPGNQRGGAWATMSLDHPHWVADVDFRVSGPERGGGNLNIWLVKDGLHDIGMSSVYTAGRFEGLVLVLDVSGSQSTGSLRGYLNDGIKEFRSLTGIDSLAFGHCDFSYRNLGRPSQIKIQQTNRSFRVDIDGNFCFASDDVFIPTGYHFGITAASAEVPDSMEIFKFVVMTDDGQGQHQSHESHEHHDQQQQQQQQQEQQDQQRPMGDGQTPVRITRAGIVEDTPEGRAYEKDLPDVDANTITSSKAQFADLHSRLQSVNHHLSTIFRQVATSDQVGEKRHEEVSIQLGQLKGFLSKLDRLEMIEDKLEQMERDMRSLHNELRQSLTNTEQQLMYHVTGHLQGHHDKLAEELKHPGHARLIMVIVGGQIFLACSYFIYKRRKASSPKKYL